MTRTGRSTAGTGDSCRSSGGPKAEEADGTAVARIDALQLFGEAREVVLVYEQQSYRLRRTHSGKLILTK